MTEGVKTMVDALIYWRWTSGELTRHHQSSDSRKVIRNSPESISINWNYSRVSLKSEVKMRAKNNQTKEVKDKVVF